MLALDIAMVTLLILLVIFTCLCRRRRPMGDLNEAARQATEQVIPLLRTTLYGIARELATSIAASFGGTMGNRPRDLTDRELSNFLLFHLRVQRQLVLNLHFMGRDPNTWAGLPYPGTSGAPSRGEEQDFSPPFFPPSGNPSSASSTPSGSSHPGSTPRSSSRDLPSGPEESEASHAGAASSLGSGGPSPPPNPPPSRSSFKEHIYEGEGQR